MFENLEILKFPDERLRRLSAPVEAFNKELKALADKMLPIKRNRSSGAPG